MSDYSELVKRLYERGTPEMPDVSPGDQDCYEAAQAIELLEKQLAEARAEVERKDKLINRAGAFLLQGGKELARRTLNEDLAAPEPDWLEQATTVDHLNKPARRKEPTPAPEPTWWFDVLYRAEQHAWLSGWWMRQRKAAQQRESGNDT